MKYTQSDRIRKYLSPDIFAWVIKDTFNHSELASFMERAGIIYQGVRTITVSHSQLALDLAEESFNSKDVASLLIKKLDVSNLSTIEEVESLGKKEIDGYLEKNIELFWRGQKIGGVIWAMLVDERQAVNEKIPYFIEMVDKFGEELKIDNMMKDTLEEFFNKKGPKLYKFTLDSLKKNNKDLHKINKQQSEENRKLMKKIKELRERNKVLEKLNSHLNQEKGVLKKNLQKNEEKIILMHQEIDREKEKLNFHPKRILQTSLHRLDKEYRKLNHQLEKEREQNKGRITDLERQIVLLKEETEVVKKRERELRDAYREEQEENRYLEQYLEHGKKKEVTPSSYPQKGKRVGVFIDVQNVYYAAKAHFSKKVDYSKLLSFLVGNRYLVKAICYIVQHPELNQESFINMLKKKGYIVKMRDLILRADGSAKGNWDIGMAVDVLSMVDKDKLDIIVLVTCDGDFVDLVKVLKRKTVKVEVAGFPKTTAVNLKRISDEFIPIEENLMLDTDEKSNYPFNSGSY